MGHYLNTGLIYCYNEDGSRIDCRGSGQDAEYRTGEHAPSPRFETRGEIAIDRLTGLIWTRNANPADFPLTWSESLEFISGLNNDEYAGIGDWRMPNRAEMRSLISYQHRKPALPDDHPFKNVFLNWYWTGTTAAKNNGYAWYVHLEGGRMFYGKKDQSYMVWPVNGISQVLPATGQARCFDTEGVPVRCSGTGQDGERRTGVEWPEPRFEVEGDVVLDRLTRLYWTQNASLADSDVDWLGALDVVSRLNKNEANPSWRLPTINELESLVDARRHDPALPENHPFVNVREFYASSTTSGFETDWIMLLHLHKGAVGVGRKNQNAYAVWAVRSAE